MVQVVVLTKSYPFGADITAEVLKRSARADGSNDTLGHAFVWHCEKKAHDEPSYIELGDAWFRYYRPMYGTGFGMMISMFSHHCCQ